MNSRRPRCTPPVDARRQCDGAAVPVRLVRGGAVTGTPTLCRIHQAEYETFGYRVELASTRVHELKTDIRFWPAVDAGTKTFEVRKDDREGGFQVGDLLILREYDPGQVCKCAARAGLADQGLTGRSCRRSVRFVLRHEDLPQALQPGYVVLALK